MKDSDPYTYAGTDVLRNKADIRDAATLAEYEYRKSGERMLEQQEAPIQGRFDLKHLQAIHKHLFQDVYEWAGELRTVGISKGNSYFAHPDMIEGYANSAVFKDIAKDRYLVGMDKEPFVSRLAHHYAEINALHPFREGNGRSTRQFIQQLAAQAGYEIDYSKVEQVRWNEAARESFAGRLEPMKQVFSDIISPSNEQRADAFRTLAPGEAVKKHPELAGAVALLTAITKQAEAQGYDEKQRAAILAHAQQKIAGSIERGNLPEVKVREERDQAREKDLER